MVFKCRPRVERVSLNLFGKRESRAGLHVLRGQCDASDCDKWTHVGRPNGRAVLYRSVLVVDVELQREVVDQIVVLYPRAHLVREVELRCEMTGVLAGLEADLRCVGPHLDGRGRVEGRGRKSRERLEEVLRQLRRL